MYENIAHGDQVIDAYSSLKGRGKSQVEILSVMTGKILSVGPGRVSRHTADLRKINVVDIAPSSISLALQKNLKLP